MAMRFSFGTASFGVVALTATMIACATGGNADSGGDTGGDTDSGAVVGDEGGQTGDDSGGQIGFDSGSGGKDSGGAQQDSGAPPGDSGNPPQDASGGDSSPPPDASLPDSSPPDASPPDSAPPPDSGAVCNKPSGNPCALTPNCGCPAGQKCDVNPNSATADVCVNTTSSGTQSASCNGYPDCSAGFACICTAVDPFFGNCTAQECEAWCILGGPNVCTGNTTCKALGSTITLGGQNYGTCQ